MVWHYPGCINSSVGSLPTLLCNFCGKECKNNNYLGGYNPTGDRGKKGWYCGYWCDSIWELAWVIYQLDHGLVFVKNTVRFQYTYGNKLRNYIPDFFIPATNTYVEIKGYRSVNELKEIIGGFIAANGIAGPKGIGLVMKMLKEQYDGLYDGRIVSDVVKGFLVP